MVDFHQSKPGALYQDSYLKDITLADEKRTFSGHRKAAGVVCLGVSVCSLFTGRIFLMKAVLTVSCDEKVRKEQVWFGIRVSCCAPADCMSRIHTQGQAPVSALSTFSCIRSCPFVQLHAHGCNHIHSCGSGYLCFIFSHFLCLVLLQKLSTWWCEPPEGGIWWVLNADCCPCPAGLSPARALSLVIQGWVLGICCKCLPSSVQALRTAAVFSTLFLGAFSCRG